MAIRQIGCGATALLSDGERAWLRMLPDLAGDIPTFGWCELEPGHEGEHYQLGQYSGDRQWWLRWHDETNVRHLGPEQSCPAEDEPDERSDRAPCVLFLDHPGRHSFEYDVGVLPEQDRPPLALPVGADLNGLSSQQLANHRRLHAEGLTVWAFSFLAQLLITEEIMGEKSMQHAGGTTDIPLPQIARYPAVTPGLAAAVARGYLIAHPKPPYEPLYGGTRADTVAVELTSAGRAVCRRVDADRFARPECGPTDPQRMDGLLGPNGHA